MGLIQPVRGYDRHRGTSFLTPAANRLPSDFSNIQLLVYTLPLVQDSMTRMIPGFFPYSSPLRAENSYGP